MKFYQNTFVRAVRLKRLFFSLILSTGILMASAACASDLPDVLPFSPSVGNITDYEENGYVFSDMVYEPDDPGADEWGYISTERSVDLYTVTLPYGTRSLILDFSEDRLAYGYDGSGVYVSSFASDADSGYRSNGQEGEKSAHIYFDDDKFTDFIRIQTPYDLSWKSETLYSVRLEFEAENSGLSSDIDIKWSDLSSEPIDEVTSDLLLPDKDSGSGMEITWISSDTKTLGNDGTVSRPSCGKKDRKIVLTAIVGDGTFSTEKTFHITVLAENEEAGTSVNTDELLESIAESYIEDDSEWVILDMADYARINPGSSLKTSGEARQSYINKAIQSLQQSSLNETACAKAVLSLTALGVDITELYPADSDEPVNAVSLLNEMTHSSSAWSAPYTLAAYAQGNYGTGLYEDFLLKAVLENQEENGCWDEYSTIDTTGNMIAALALYRDREGVQDAIDKAVIYLSEHQKDNGVFDDGQTGEYAAGDNANSTAMVVIGLAANGINPAADARFIRNGHSLMDGLLSFALTDNSGFGYADGREKNSYSTEQCFRALIAATLVMADGKEFNVYDFSSAEVFPAQADGNESRHETGNISGDYISVYVSVKADTGYWMKDKLVSIPGNNAMVSHALLKALENSGISQEGAEDGYVYSMTKNGRTLSEFTGASNSGWLYNVNGSLPVTGMTSCEIQNGDIITIYYTEDWTKDPYAGSAAIGSKADPDYSTFILSETALKNGTALSKVGREDINNAVYAAGKTGTDIIEIIPDISEDADRITVELPLGAVNEMVSETDITLKIHTPAGTVCLPCEVLSGILSAAEGNDISVTLEKIKVTDVHDGLINFENMKGAAAFDLTISSDKKTIPSFGGKALEIMLPADDMVFKNGKSYLVFFIDDEGRIKQTKAVVKDEIAVISLINSTSVLLTSSASLSFSGMECEAFCFNAEDGTVNGIYENDALLEPLKDDEGPVISVNRLPFTDVEESDFYYEAVLWAVENGIASGTSDTSFSPDEPVSRAQSVVFLFRLSREKAYQDNPFTDVQDDAYYADAVKWAAACGITSGTSDTTFSPDEQLTDAQSAAFLYRFAEKGNTVEETPADPENCYAQALRWASANGITRESDDSTLLPENGCTRAQFITSLYRCQAGNGRYMDVKY